MLGACERQTLLMGVNPPGAAVVPLVNRGPLGQTVPVAVGEALENDGPLGVTPRGQGVVGEAEAVAGPAVIVPDPEPLGPLPSERAAPQELPRAIIYDDVEGAPTTAPATRPVPIDPVALPE